MKPSDIQQIQNEIAIRWDDGAETYIPLEKLRRNCPCAACAGEGDVLGRKHQGPRATYTALSFQLVRFEAVGGYAISLVWADGHQTGIYSYPYLKELGQSSPG